ncbi:ribonuclease III [Candidatus Peregrinibacteria bacterium CG10_big_fil_rev_8_21_14_0_10_49_24]|nr:MAG: ribonuclease III [Candidatus Peregrinibacteria bacterium CG11_big_fil_rev_8_21_14_0_20_49_14]PIR50840.1 MAG: ribonuclease III [Candidatus Peregrinibacteria bacterium CG10_big_fil_rev_8_21_14_0_10_49_24]PJA67400.1 MAG: ribonuclease III [Candidatus Peregrinibacteria bacterium CG_4_9_14_3_um_filter_49_12]
MSQPESFVLLEKSIGIVFRNKDYLMQALTHRSSTRQSRTNGHNERLEFLGDAVLELVATEYLFRFSEKSEGELTSWRSALVKGEHLATVSQEIQLGRYLFMSRGEEASGGREKASTLANALEALIGAIYMDQGFEKATAFCNDFILVRLQEILKEGAHRDDKSYFQERAQDIYGVTPHYDVMEESGPDHDKVFTSAVFIGDEKVAEGSGNSKQRAEQAAAKEGIKAKDW